ncbi:MAG: hypothetical protein HY321_17455 [Armatimonadetes bacterium]|nr:hypothetical protein [Armatimonadota bacterium]
MDAPADSGTAMAESAAQALDLAVEEVTLSTEAAAGQPPPWVAQTRDRRFTTPFDTRS